MSEDYFVQLMQLNQTRSLREYYIEFEHISSRIADIPQDRLVSAFIGDLENELLTDV